MQLTWTALFLLCAAGAAAMFWHTSLAAREQANGAAAKACSQLQLQFLDGTVAFASFMFARASDGWLALRRTYVFDYTADSIERRQGFVILLGTHVESIGFAPEVQSRAMTITRSRDETHREAAHTQDAVQDAEIKTPEVRESRSNVLDLQEWRRRHQSSDAPRIKDGQGGNNR
jgi:hypothetical protein